MGIVMSYIPFGEVIVTVDFTDGLLSDVYTDVVDAGVTDAFFPSCAISTRMTSSRWRLLPSLFR